jgi:hypothetical protein
MDPCVQLTYWYHDTDVVELKVSAWNGTFAGSTCLYIGQGDLANIATQLAGFTVDLKDQRELTFGAFGPKFAGGAMTLGFSCVDGAGHCRLRLIIEADYDVQAPVAQRVEMLCAFEPAALDHFVQQMRELNSSLTGSAVLALLQS